MCDQSEKNIPRYDPDKALCSIADRGFCQNLQRRVVAFCSAAFLWDSMVECYTFGL